MNDIQHHRGPDGDGVEVVSESPLTVFGHRRLAILDLSPRGKQPMVDSSNRFTIVFNGEVYNFKELRTELECLGRRFRSETDTEVILEAFVTWGEQFVGRLQGIFALAICDRVAGRIFLARDQLGVKPLYYFHNSTAFAFASEVRTLLASELIPRHICIKGLNGYLTFGSVQEPHTLVAGMVSLPPGHTMWFEDDTIRTSRYWQPTCQIDQHASEPTDPCGIPSLLRQAVTGQLISDVPVGCFLSGGIDSTAIAAEMQHASISSVRTFSIIFDESEYDERHFSRLAASHIGTQHEELLLTEQYVVEHLDQALSAFDQPSLDGLNTYFVSRLVKAAGLTVALSGVGGDELFVGYDRFQRQLQFLHWAKKLSALPFFLRKRLAGFLQMAVGRNGRLSRVADVLSAKIPAYFGSRQVLSTSQVQHLVSPAIRSTCDSWMDSWQRDSLEIAKSLDDINQISLLELQQYMVSTLLRDADQMSMANSLEVRVPLIDHKLVEAVLAIPGRLKISTRMQKPLLVDACRAGIPDECVFRGKKGFVFPFDGWIRSALHDRVAATFEASTLDVFSQDELQQLWRAFKSKRVGWSRIWHIFVLATWLQKHSMRLA